MIAKPRAETFKPFLEKEPLEKSEDSETVLVSAGVPGYLVDLRIVDPESKMECRPGKVGEVWTRSPSVAAGYLNDPEATEKVFLNRIVVGKDENGKDEHEDERVWLRTGDMGLLHEGQLYITARYKDVLSVRGRTINPEDVEGAVEGAHAAVIKGTAMAFMVSHVEGQGAKVIEVEEDRKKKSSVTSYSSVLGKRHANNPVDIVVVVAEIRRKDISKKEKDKEKDKEKEKEKGKGGSEAFYESVIQNIRERVRLQYKLHVDVVLLLKPDSLIMTEPGKKPRHKVKTEFLTHGISGIVVEDCFVSTEMRTSHMSSAASTSPSATQASSPPPVIGSPGPRRSRSSLRIKLTPRREKLPTTGGARNITSSVHRSAQGAGSLSSEGGEAAETPVIEERELSEKEESPDPELPPEMQPVFEKVVDALLYIVEEEMDGEEDEEGNVKKVTRADLHPGVAVETLLNSVHFVSFKDRVEETILDGEIIPMEDLLMLGSLQSMTEYVYRRTEKARQGVECDDRVSAVVLKVLEDFKKEDCAAALNGQSLLRDLFDSSCFIEAKARIEDELLIIVSIQELLDLITVQDLLECVKAKVQVDQCSEALFSAGLSSTPSSLPTSENSSAASSCTASPALSPRYI